MFIDSRKLQTHDPIEKDICIIGGGAAGITIARELANTSYDVCILESGGKDFDEETHALTNFINIGREYFHGARLRFFGGSTNHWGGHCLPLRGINFEQRAWIPYSGWPFPREHLDPYYERAHDVLGLGEFQYNSAIVAKELGLELFSFDSSKVESVVSRYHPVRFGQEFEKDLLEAPNISLYLYANVTQINRDIINDRIVTVDVKTLAGNSFLLQAKYYVLATGGIENPRILLASNQVQKEGLGNQNDLVGRFFMEHIWYRSSLILTTQDRVFKIYKEEQKYQKDVNIRCQIALPENISNQLQIPEFRAELGMQPIPHKYLKRKQNIWSIAEAILNDSKPVVYQLFNFVEQVPNPDSRIALSEAEDALGMEKATMDWRLSPIDKAGMITAQKWIAAEVGRSSSGRMRIEVPTNENIILEGAQGGGHHMGTTRMHDNPKLGVVDANCCVHGLANLFVAGSSVFPTGGYSNPTLTIVALALRLSDHLKKLCSGVCS